jgi:cell division septation protein DedD
MSSNGRREGVKIVAPLTPNREVEIVGGLKNALDRGETLAKAKQTFLSAGYKQEEINAAVQKMPTTTSQIGKPVTAPAKTPTPTTQQKAQPSPTTTTKMPEQKKHISKKFIIILISCSVLVLIGAALLGIFWDKIF